jgi:hypothetical protein
VDTTSRDELTWFGTKEGIYTVKSGYQAVVEWKSARNDYAGSNAVDTNPLWKNLRKLRSPPKYTNLIWIINHAIPVRDKLTSKGIRCNPICPRCNKALETIEHVFMQCEWAKAIWFGSPMTINFEHMLQEVSFQDWLSDLITNKHKRNIEHIIVVIYHIWKARNLLIFQNKDVPVMTVGDALEPRRRWLEDRQTSWKVRRWG